MKLQDMTMSQLVALYNQHADVPVTRFATKQKGVERTQKVLPEDKPAKSRGGSGAFIRELILAQELTDDEIVEASLARFGGRTKRCDVSWNRCQLKKRSEER